MRIARGIFAAAALLSLIAVQAQAQDAADVVFTNGKVYTVNELRPWAEAVAVSGNKIVYVGDNAGYEIEVYQIRYPE